MRGASLTLGLLAALAGSGAVAAHATVTTVIGQDDPASDRQAIQDAIDAAAPDTTILLLGSFALDGERVVVSKSGLRIAGEAVDDDGDGEVQEDWSDGRDNDGDGLLDEDGWETTLRGVSAPGGGPATDDGTNGLFNRGLVVEGTEIERLEVRDLHFVGFHRAVELIPEWASPTGRCDDRTRVAGSAEGVRIERNRFEDNVLGITVLGAVDRSSIRANVFERNQVFGAVVEGGAVECPLSGGGGVDLALATPRSFSMTDNLAVDGGLATAFTEDSKVQGNVIEDTILGFLSISDRSARIRNNSTFDCLVGLIVVGGKDVQVTGNLVIDALIGLELSELAEGVRVSHNHVLAAELAGILVDPGASGFHMAENTFADSSFVDVLLDFESFDNEVINRGEPAITVLDFGEGNRLVGDIIQF